MVIDKWPWHHLHRPSLKPLQGFTLKYMWNSRLNIALLTVCSVWVFRYSHSQCSGRHIPTAGDRLQRERPGSQAPQTHRASPRDLCMNWMPLTWRLHIHCAPGGRESEGHKACRNWFSLDNRHQTGKEKVFVVPDLPELFFLFLMLICWSWGARGPNHQKPANGVSTTVINWLMWAARLSHRRVALHLRGSTCLLIMSSAILTKKNKNTCFKPIERTEMKSSV